MRLSALILLVFASVAQAATYYVTQSGAGSKNGSSLGNAFGVTELNAATLAGDDVVSINGTLTSRINVPSSGTSGHQITFLFAAGAKMSSAAWDSNGAINLFSKDYITIDGGTNGLIENTANGNGLANSIESYGVKAQNATGLTVQNLAISNIYVAVAGTGNRTDSAAIQNHATSASFSNMTVTNCVIHDAYIGIDTDYGAGASNYTFSGNTIYNCNWGGGTGDRGATSTLTTVSIHNNLFYNWQNWDDVVGNTAHHNGWYIFAENGGSYSSVSVYNNTFGPGFCKTTPNQQTSGMFFSGTNVSGILCYNNLFVANTGEYCSNGFIEAGSNTLATTNRIYNNTFALASLGRAIDLAGTTVWSVENNLISNAGTGIAFDARVTGSLTSNYNLFYGLAVGQNFAVVVSGVTTFYTFAQWKVLGYDANSINGSDPLLTGTYGLGAGSPAIGTGTDLSAYFTTDAAGYTRTVPWDIGAYKYLYPSTAASGTILISGRTTIL